MQVELRIDQLPEAPLDAAAEFHCEFLGEVQDRLEGQVMSLAILLPPASSDHDDWRRALARDLAREYAPKRVTVIGRTGQEALDAMLAYLRDAPGITGQYLPLHD